MQGPDGARRGAGEGDAVSDTEYLMAASNGALRRAEQWRRLGPYPSARLEALAEMRHHIKCRAKARAIAKQAKAVTP